MHRAWQVLETMYQEQRSCRHRDFAYSCVHKCRWKHAQIKIESNANPDKSQQKCSVLCIELPSIGNNVSRATIMQTSWFCIFMCAQMSMKTCSNQNRQQCKPRQISAKVQCFVHRAVSSIREYSCVHKCIKSKSSNPDLSKSACRHRDQEQPLHIHVCTNVDENMLKSKSTAMQTPTNLSKSAVFCASSLTSIGNNVSRATIMQTSWFCIFMCAQMSMKTCSNQNRQQCKPRQISAKVQCFVHRVDKYWKQCIKSNDHADFVILHIHVCTNVDENMLKSKSRAMQTPTNLSKSAVFCASSWQVLETMYQEQRSCRHRDFAYSCVHKCRWKHAQIKIDSNANPDKSQQKCSVLCIELIKYWKQCIKSNDHVQTSWFCIFMCAQMSMKTCSNQNRQQCKPRQISAKVQCFVHPASKYLRICIYATIVQTSWIAYSCVHKSRWKHTQTQIESNANPDKSQQKCNVLCIQLQVFTNMYLCNHCADFVNCIFMCAQISMKTYSNSNREQCKPRQISAKV